jgi:hypothetical protein
MLDAFTFELPDPDQELFFQYPITFPQFPQLVLELRLMIWKEASPRSWHFMKEAACGTLRHNYKCKAVTPITSRICQESRCETLIRYQNLTSIRSTGPPSCMPCQARRKDRTFFWHGGRDVLILPSTWLNLDNFKNLLSSHYTQDELSFKNFCASIRTLALSLWCGCPLAREDIAKVWETFRGLQNLQLIDTTQGRDDPSCRLIGKNAQDCLDTFAQTFKRLRGRIPKFPYLELSSREMENLSLVQDSESKERSGKQVAWRGMEEYAQVRGKCH